MTVVLIYINFILFVCIVFFILYAIIVSINEKERKAAIRFVILGAFGVITHLFFITYIFQISPLIYQFILTLIIPFTLLIVFAPFSREEMTPDFSKCKYDERDIIFSKRLLIKGTGKYNEFYRNKSELEAIDTLFRKEPGLLSSESKFYDVPYYKAIEANFKAIQYFKPGIYNNPVSEIIETNPNQITSFIKSWAIHMGAHSVGVTALKPYHLYSYKGIGLDEYGNKIENNHKYAIAFTVEMDFLMTRHAPTPPVTAESSKQYLVAATIGVQLAEMIRLYGYEARAHIDANYELVCPLVASDAGLGVIGRMGLLITPKIGPRVRIAVITTNLPLVEDNVKYNTSVDDFCRICKKCAKNCPSKSISFNDKEMINETLRWKINSESCYTYWCKAGTDCGRCMAVCPYSHPDNFLHNIVRIGIRNSKLFRYIAVKMDDIIYGVKPERLNIYYKDE